MANDEILLDACGEDRDVGELIAAARNLVQAGMHEKVARSHVSSDDPALQEYLRNKFRGRSHEELHAIFVDDARGYLCEELVAVGDAGRVETRIRPILTRALELRAKGFFLVHNHPSQSPEPSIEDISSTKHISQIAQALELEVFDHLIIAGSEVFSMREAGLL